MAPITNKDTKVCYAPETNYAGGIAGAKYSMAQIITNTALLKMNLPADKSNYGGQEWERKRVRPVGQNAQFVALFDKGLRWKEFTVTQYVQNTTWIIAAAGAAGLTAGSIPQSYCFHCEIPGVNGAIDYFDIFGAVVENYEIILDPEDWPKEKITFIYYAEADSAAITDTDNTFDVAQPKIFKDYNVEIGGTALSHIVTKASLRIMNKYPKSVVAGKLYKQDPILISQEVEFDFDTVDDNDDNSLPQLFADPKTEAENLVTVSVTGWGVEFSCTNMYNDTDNSNEIEPELELFTFMYQMRMGGACVISCA